MAQSAAQRAMAEKAARELGITLPPAPSTASYTRDSSGTYQSTGSTNMVPVQDNGSVATNPIQLSAGGRSLPMEGTGATMATTTPTQQMTGNTAPGITQAPTDPYTSFSTQLIDILKNAQRATQQSREALMASKEGLENASINLSNPLAETPYEDLFAGMSPEASLAAQKGTQAAAVPGVQRIENIMSLNQQNLTDTTALISAMSQLPVVQQAKMAQDTVFNLAQSYPDAGIQPGDSLDVAQRKVNSSPSFQAKNTLYTIDPLTGQPIIIDKKLLGGSSPYETGVGGFGGASAAPGFGASAPSSYTGSSTDVQALQQWLVNQGYMTQADMNTGPGIYGPRTQAAVAAFQRDAGVDISGGGAGAFGPRTQSAAAQRGFSMGGGASSGGATPAPVDLSELHPNLRAAVSDFGDGIRFFDETKLTPSQIPYAQQASVQYSIPFLDTTSAEKIKNTYQQYQSAAAIIQQVQQLATTVLQAENTRRSMFTQGVGMTVTQYAPWLSTDDAEKQFIAQRNAVLTQLSKATGQVGVLTDQDLKIIADAMPGFYDNADLAAQKAQRLDGVIREVLAGAARTYLGTMAPPSFQAGASAGGDWNW